MFPWRRDEKKGRVRRENEELKEGLRVAMALRPTPGITRSYGVKGSAVSVTRPALFRSQTCSWNDFCFLESIRGIIVFTSCHDLTARVVEMIKSNSCWCASMSR